MGLEFADGSGYRHTVVTTNQGTFSCNPWSDRSTVTSSGTSLSLSAPAKAWGPLQVLNSLESTGHDAPKLFDLDSLHEDKPKLSRLEKKRIAAKRQRERKKCEITEACQQLAQLQAQAAALQTQNESLRLRSTVMETLVKTSDDQLRLASLVSQVADNAQAARAQGSASCQSTPGLGCDLKDLSLAKLNVEEFRELWKKVVGEGTALCNSDACQETLDQFALDVMTWMENWSMVSGTSDYLTVVSVELEHGTQAQPACDHWCEVARSLNLTAQQRQQALVGLQVIKQLMEGVANEQRALCGSLDAVSHEVYPVAVDDPVVEKLAGALCRERFVLDMADAFVWKHVLSSRQKLSALLTSYPFYPDAISILNGIQQVSHKDGMDMSSDSVSASPSDSWSS